MYRSGVGLLGSDDYGHTDGGIWIGETLIQIKKARYIVKREPNPDNQVMRTRIPIRALSWQFDDFVIHIIFPGDSDRLAIKT
ncbi:hypothetical protein AUP07_0398 [methanogenic archaeon mixed culture ISO4-G1]|nr:hypothetical protein AUP07_0398 [methanogenic archaeon mixed culture ISO4-G1]